MQSSLAEVGDDDDAKSLAQALSILLQCDKRTDPTSTPTPMPTS